MASETLRKVGRNKVIEIPDKPVYGGSFSKVYFGRFDKKDVAVKKIDCFNLKTEEPQLLRSFDHENIVRYLYMDEDRENQYIVLEKCECTLRAFINDKEREIPHKSIDILKEISCGLAYLHEMRIIHRDLKPCNILLMFSGGKWRAKISDFGISKILDDDKTQVTQTQTSIKGSVGYRAPEILKKEKISKRADIFSLGITFFYVFSEGEHPYGSDNLKIDCDIRDGEGPNLNGLGDFEHDATKLILSMIAHQPDDRPVINEIQAHHIFWTDEKIVRYFQDVSDYCIEPKNCETIKPILEAEKKEIVGNWRESISDPVVKKVLEDMKNKRQGDGVCDLLRNIRNLKNHYQEKPPEFHKIVGKKSDGLAKWFTQEFPKLLPYVYEKMKCRKEDSCFEEYYYMKTEANQNPQIDPSPSNPESIEELEDNEIFLVSEGIAEREIDIWNESMGFDWKEIIRPLLHSHTLLITFVENERRQALTDLSRRVYPPAKEVFSWTQHCSFQDVKVVIVGQDPYPQPGMAHGLAFSIKNRMTNLPSSLKNILKAVEKQYPSDFHHPDHYNLTRWAEQGVLLLNRILTVQHNAPMSHVGRGWEEVTNGIIRHISKEAASTVFMLWGKSMEEKLIKIDNVQCVIKAGELKTQGWTPETEMQNALVNSGRHLVITSSHPSSLSAHRGFFDLPQFCLANRWLCMNSRGQIEWTDLLARV